MVCNTSMLKISRIQRIRNSEIREKAGGMTKIEDMVTLRRARWLHKIVIVPAHRGSKKIAKKVLAAWVQSSNDPSVRGDRSNRERCRLWQTTRHGHRNTLRRLGFTDGTRRAQTNYVLMDRMTVAKGRGRWGALVEEKLGLTAGAFTSLYKG